MDNINKLYNFVIDNEVITTKDLNNLGFNNHHITKLITDGYLIRIKRGYYKFINGDKLYEYANLLNDKEIIHKILLKILEIDPNNFKVSFKLFSDALKEKKYDNIFNYLSVLFKTNNPYLQKDNNLYLFLLSYVTKVPEEYQEKLRNLKLEDINILEGDNRFQKIKKEKEIRELLFLQRFGFAFFKIVGKQNSILHDNLKNILKEVKIKLQEEIELLNKLFLDNNIKGMIEYLEKIKEFRILRKYEKYLLITLYDLAKLQNGEEFLINDGSFSKNLNEALLKHDYLSAYFYINISENWQNFNGDNLLNEIIKKIVDVLKSRGIYFLDRDKLINTLNKDVDLGIKIIHHILKEKNKLEYENLVVDMLRLALEENDKYYIEALNTLSLILYGKYEFNLDSYINSFKESIKEKNINKASIYFDIISSSHTLDDKKDIINLLEKTLLASYKKYWQDNNINNKVTTIINNSLEDITLYNASLIGTIEKEAAELIKRKIEYIPNLKLESVMLKDGKIYYYLRKLMRSKEIILNRNAFVKDAVSLYKDEMYASTIYILNDLQENSNYLNCDLCSLLGMSYLKCEDYKGALIYFTLATILPTNTYNYRAYIEVCKKALEEKQNRSLI